MRLAGLAIVSCAALALAAGAQTPLQATLTAMAAGYDGHVALYAKNLTTGASMAVDADRPVATASVIKVALMLEAMRQVKAGRLSLSQPLTLTKHNQVPGSGILQILTPGERLSLRDTMALMFTLSDNTATNMVIDAVGLAPTNAFLQQIGMKDTHFYKKVFLPAKGPQPADQKQFGLGKTTAREMGELLERLWTCNVDDRALCRTMINIMRDQQNREMIPRYLNDGNASDGLSPIADKVGELDAVRNDVALVYTKRGPIILSIFTYDNPDQSWTPDNRAELFIGRLAKTIVDAWSPKGLAQAIPHLLAVNEGKS